MSRRSSNKQKPVSGDENNTPEFSSEQLDNRRVPWHIQPPSKNAICHVDYRLGDAAVLCVIPILVGIKGGANDKLFSVPSRKLRREAITEFLTRHALSKNIAFHLAQKIIEGGDNSEEKTYPMDQLILFESDKSNLSKLSGGTHKLETTFMTVKGVNDRIHESIYCSIDFDRLQEMTATDPKTTEYWRKLQILLRKFTQTATSSPTDKATVFCTRTGSLLREAPKLTSSTIKSKDSKNAPGEAPKFNTLFRTTLKLDPNDRKIRVETDIVPGVKGGTNLADLILGVFGFAIVDPGNPILLAKAKAMLVGLNVIRTYSRQTEPTSTTKAAATGLSHESGTISKSPESKARPLADNTTSTNNTVTGTPKRSTGKAAKKNSKDFPASIIIDLKQAGEVPDFWKDNVRYAVAKYFKVCKLLSLIFSHGGHGSDFQL